MLAYLIVCLFGIAAAKSTLRSAPVYELEDAEIHFEAFIKRHGIQYEYEYERKYRFEIFKMNLEEVNRLNDGQRDARFGLTLFMDRTYEEFYRLYTGFGQDITNQQNCPFLSEEQFQHVQAPDTFDWRNYEVVTPIKNQYSCGSCYAFSAIANVESQYAIKYGQQIDLAEQQIVDCDVTNKGCISGFTSNAFLYLIQAGGALSEYDFPYLNMEGTCLFRESRAPVRVADCRSYSFTSQERLKQLLYTNGPISVAIKSTGIRTYDGGLITDERCNNGSIDHGVLLVGYGYLKDEPIWIAKNSWGTNWGEQGYFYFARGEHLHSCGMMESPMSSAILA